MHILQDQSGWRRRLQDAVGEVKTEGLWWPFFHHCPASRRVHAFNTILSRPTTTTQLIVLLILNINIIIKIT